MNIKTTACNCLATFVASLLTPGAFAGDLDQARRVFTPVAHASTAGFPRLPAASGTLTAVNAQTLKMASPGQQMSLGAGADAVVGRIERIERRSERSFSIFGRLPDDPDGFFILAVEGDAVAGLIEAPLRRQRFKVNYLANGVHEIVLDRHELGGCATSRHRQPKFAPDLSAPAPIPATPEGAQPFDDAPEGVCSAPPRHFDVLIVYTPAARAEAGGTDAIQAECQLAADSANQAYVDSQINARIVLVQRQEIEYYETSDVEIDRDKLADPEDGVMDGVHALRNAYGADVVCLLVNASDPDNCGIAFCTPSDSSEGFCVVQRQCAVGSTFSFAHEIGHLQGCAHNVEDAGSGCNEYCYSFGSRFFGNSGSGWRSIMSYNNGENGGGDYTRINKFSNPNVTHDGVAIGYACTTQGPLTLPGAYNAQTVNNTTANRESWRSPRFEVWVELGVINGFPRGTFQEPWPTVSFGAGAIYDGPDTPYIQPTLWIKAGTTAETLTLNRQMTIRACGGTVRIGQ